MENRKEYEGCIKKGDKYGMLTALEYNHTIEKQRNKKTKDKLYLVTDYIRYWKFKCDCGEEKIIELFAVKSGNSKSCGCKTIEAVRQTGINSRLSEGEAAGNATLLTYIKNAKKRNIKFELSSDEFFWLTKQDCYYCGDKPSNKYKSISNCGDYIYNGIDRVNSKEGYNFNNCVSCCRSCNLAKTDKSIEDHNEWLKRLVNHNKHLIENYGD